MCHPSEIAADKKESSNRCLLKKNLTPHFDSCKVWTFHQNTWQAYKMVFLLPHPSLKLEIRNVIMNAGQVVHWLFSSHKKWKGVEVKKPLWSFEDSHCVYFLPPLCIRQSKRKALLTHLFSLLSKQNFLREHQSFRRHQSSPSSCLGRSLKINDLEQF